MSSAFGISSNCIPYETKGLTREFKSIIFWVSLTSWIFNLMFLHRSYWNYPSISLLLLIRCESLEHLTKLEEREKEHTDPSHWPWYTVPHEPTEEGSSKQISEGNPPRNSISSQVNRTQAQEHIIVRLRWSSLKYEK